MEVYVMENETQKVCRIFQRNIPTSHLYCMTEIALQAISFRSRRKSDIDFLECLTET